MMDAGNQLIAIAQISVTLAGFAGVVATFHFRGPEPLSKASFVRLRIMIELSLFVCMFSLLPLALHNFGALENIQWKISKVLFLLFSGSYLTLFATRWSRGLIGKKGLNKTITVVASTIAILFTLLLAIDVLGVLHTRDPYAMYVSVLYVDLGFVSLQFARLVILPLLRSFEGETPNQQR